MRSAASARASRPSCACRWSSRRMPAARRSMQRWPMPGWPDLVRALGAALLSLAAVAVPASAQRLVALDYKMGSDSDFVVLVDLSNVRRGGDISDALATVEHLEPFFRADGRAATRRWLRIQFNCATRE